MRLTCGFVQRLGIGSRAVELHQTDMIGRKHATGRKEEVYLGVIQAAYRSPLLAEQPFLLHLRRERDY